MKHHTKKQKYCMIVITCPILKEVEKTEKESRRVVSQCSMEELVFHIKENKVELNKDNNH